MFFILCKMKFTNDFLWMVPFVVVNNASSSQTFCNCVHLFYKMYILKVWSDFIGIGQLLLICSISSKSVPFTCFCLYEFLGSAPIKTAVKKYTIFLRDQHNLMGVLLVFNYSNNGKDVDSLSLEATHRTSVLSTLVTVF